MKCLNFSENPNDSTKKISNYSRTKMYNKKESFLQELWNELKEVSSTFSFSDILFFIFFILGIFLIFYFYEFTLNHLVCKFDSNNFGLKLLFTISAIYIVINLILSFILAIITNHFYVIYTQKSQLSNIKCISCTLLNKVKKTNKLTEHNNIKKNQK